MSASRDAVRRSAANGALKTRSPRCVAIVSVFLLVSVGLVVVDAGPAGASSAPGMPGTPIAAGMNGAVALRWSAPADVGSPPLTQYRVEVNDGSGWSTATATHGADALVAGVSHTCALLSNGTVKCWGNSDAGQLGLGDAVQRGDGAGEMGDSLPAVDLGTGRTAVALTAGDFFTCALLDNGSVKCWGTNANGQLGLGDTASRGDGPGEMGDNLPPVDLGTGRTAVAISAGNIHTCALLDNGSVKCWGFNGAGQLGLGDTEGRGDGAGEMGDNLPAVTLGTGRTAVAISSGGGYSCALLHDGAVKCWGYNNYGQLGLGNTESRGDDGAEMGDSLPAVDLGTGRTAVALTAGAVHTCAVLDDTSVKCWGLGADGQLGSGDATARGDGPGEMGNSLPAVALGTGRTAVSLTAGYFHTCAVLDDATMKCWGDNDRGQLGLGDTASRGDGAGEMGDSLPAVSLGTGRTARSVVGSDRHTCSLLDDASVKCWGDNANGELGLGDTTWRGDGAGEMGDSLPVVALSSAAGGAPARAAVVRLPAGTYQFRVVAVNSAGESAPSGASTSVVVTGVPGAPTIGTVTLAGRTASVPFTAPGSNGGSPITTYTATCTSSNGGTTRTVNSAMSPASVTMLTPTKTYTCKVTATNWGMGPPSAASNSVTVANFPGAPTNAKAVSSSTTGATGSLTVTYTTPASDGGNAITKYTATCTSSTGVTGTGVHMGATAAPITVSGVTTGKTYGCRVTATNAVGDSAQSALLSTVVVGSPAPPNAVKAVSGSTTTTTGSLTVTFTLGANNGSAITSQMATCVSSNGGVTSHGEHIGAAAAPITVASVTTGKTYTCTVKAYNARGAGMGSAPSLAVSVGSPAPPTAVKAVSGSTTTATGSLTVTFTLGVNNGNAITSQTATCTSSNGGATKTGTHAGATAAPITVAGVTTGATYTCTVKATNARGAGLASAPSPAVIVGSPAAPTGVTATHYQPGKIRVAYTPGASNGSNITSFTATCTSSNNGVAGSAMGTANPFTVTGLTAGKTYTCTVKGTNARGTGLPSSASNAATA